jgi:hypothetical protein
VTEHILVGHFLLRSEAARRAGISKDELVQRPDLLRIGGTWLEEVYFAFQFDDAGIRSDLGSVVRELRGNSSDLAIAEWLASPNEVLGGATPLRLAVAVGSAASLIQAAIEAGPNDDISPESGR